MKSTENKETLAMVQRMAEISEAIKDLSTEQAALKTHLKGIMKEINVNVLAAGDYIMIISNRFRTELDKNVVQVLLGERFQSCLKSSEYQTFEIKKTR